MNTKKYINLDIPDGNKIKFEGNNMKIIGPDGRIIAHFHDYSTIQYINGMTVQKFKSTMELSSDSDDYDFFGESILQFPENIDSEGEQEE